MTLDQLRYVLAVARHSSFRVAADELNLASSTLSEQVRKLERQLGVTLFERTTRRVVVTPAGAEFVVRAAAIIDAEDALAAAMRVHRNPGPAEVRIAAPPQSLARRLPAILADARARYPEVSTFLVETSTPDVIQRLAAGDVDLGLVSWPAGQPPRELQRITLWRAPMGVVVSRSNRLAGRRTIHLRELGDLPFITFPEGYPGRSIAEEVFARAGFQPRVGMQSSVSATICEAVAGDQGFSVLYSRRALDYGLEWIPCIPRPRELLLGLCWAPNRQMDAATAALRAHIIDSWRPAQSRTTVQRSVRIAPPS